MNDRGTAGRHAFCGSLRYLTAMHAPERSASPLVPCTLAFLASASIMAVELAASRIMAQRAGSSIYSWTSVIGVVLGGMTVGNLVGGRLADRFAARRLLGTLFGVAALTTLAVPLVDHSLVAWSTWGWIGSVTNWPTLTALRVIAVFLVPSIALGLVGPVVARYALAGRGGAGNIVGLVYAAGALGSIVGTFLAGFYLVQRLGPMGVAFVSSAMLALVCIVLIPRLAALGVGICWPLLVGFTFQAFIPLRPSLYQEWKWQDGRMVLRRGLLERELHREHSQYSLIRVTELPEEGKRQLHLDSLLHSISVMGDDLAIEYQYERLYASVTERFADKDKALHALFIGGGGYVFPRYLKARWPGSRVEVAEIDPAVTEAVYDWMGLDRASTVILGHARDAKPGGLPGPGGSLLMEIYHLDARNHVEDLLGLKRSGAPFRAFDFIYGDAFNDFSVPFHLVTREFNEKIRELLAPGTGVYLVNIIDIFAAGKFLGAVVNTLAKVFPAVYVFSSLDHGPSLDPAERDTFVVVAAMGPLDLAELGSREGERPLTGAPLTQQHLDDLRRRSGGLILTDDYSPVENLLEPVVRRRLEKPASTPKP